MISDEELTQIEQDLFAVHFGDNLTGCPKLPLSIQLVNHIREVEKRDRVVMTEARDALRKLCGYALGYARVVGADDVLAKLEGIVGVGVDKGQDARPTNMFQPTKEGVKRCDP